MAKYTLIRWKQSFVHFISYNKILSFSKSSIWIFIIIPTTILASLAVGTYSYFATDLVSPERIMNLKDSGVILLDRNAKPFFTFYNARNKKLVSLSEISPHLQNAVIASEDRDFYKHSGFSFRAIVRSIITDVKQGEIVSGGSTITQQLVKISLLNSNKNFLRKYQEIILAQQIETKFSKQQILEMYLNSVYFGDGAFGAQEAANRYFNKNAKDLSIAESSILVAILPSPSALSPLSGNIEEAKQKQIIVLQQMLDQGYISKDQQKEAQNQKLVYKSDPQEINTLAPHFALMVKDALVQKYGEEAVVRSGMKVKTTIDLEWQKYAEQVVKDQVERLRVNNVSNGAAVVMDPKSGEIKALVGSVDWYNTDFGKVNLATSLRQPGSSFKPIVYAAALEQRIITPATPLHDSPITYKPQYGPSYSPRDYDGKFRGTVRVRRALANSLNIPAVEVLNKIGVPTAVETSQRFGITTLNEPSQYGLSLVLGAGEVKLLELTQAYAAFANQGVLNPATSILEITDKRKQVIYTYKPQPKRIVGEEVAFLISSILSDNQARQEIFGNTLTTTRPAAVKTGTTENYRDAWTVGYTPSLAVGVWVGNNDGRLMDNIAGSLGAAPIWKALIEHYQGSAENFIQPTNVIKIPTCGSPSGPTEYFINGTQPAANCMPAPPSPTKAVTPNPSPQPNKPSTPSPTQSSKNKDNVKPDKKQS